MEERERNIKRTRERKKEGNTLRTFPQCSNGNLMKMHKVVFLITSTRRYLITFHILLLDI